MTAATRDYYGDRPQVCWPLYWQMMAAKSTEARPWWSVMAARVREWAKRA